MSIKDIYTDNQIRTLAYRILRNMNAAQSMRGFRNTIESIVAICNNDSPVVLPVTGENGVYSKVAKSFGEEYRSVDHNIRHLIIRMTSDGNAKAINKIFGDGFFEKNAIAKKTAFISSAEFLYGIANYIIYEAENIPMPLEQDADGLFIADKDLPACCADCFCLQSDTHGMLFQCGITEEDIDDENFDMSSARHANCPLQKISMQSDVEK